MRMPAKRKMLPDGNLSGFSRMRSARILLCRILYYDHLVLKNDHLRQATCEIVLS